MGNRASGTAWSGLLCAPAVLVIIICLLLPVGYLLTLSLAPKAEESVGAAYWYILTDRFYLTVIGRTLGYTVLTLAICVVAGFFLALFIWRADARVKNLLVLVAISPLLVSIVARTYGWVVVLGDRGVINSVLGLMGAQEPLRIMYSHLAVIIGLVHILLPFMVVSILAALERINPALVEAAQTMGADRKRVITRVILPLALPGIAAGTTIVGALSMSAYVTPALMGGSEARMLANMIYQQFAITHNWQLGSALAVTLFILSILLIAALIWGLGRRTRRWSNAG